MAQEKKVYDFNSVGELESSFQENFNDEKKDFPIGFKTPLRFGTNSLFDMHTDIVEQVRDNFKNLLLTNHGERLMLYDFGANLHELAFEFSTERADTEAVKRIKRAANKYMPYIELKTFEPIIESSTQKGLISSGVKITYAIPSLNVSEQTVEAIIFSVG